MDGAGPALGDAAAIFGAGQSDRVAQHPKQRGVGVDVDLMSSSIDGDFSHWRTSVHRRFEEAMIDVAVTARPRAPWESASRNTSATAKVPVRGGRGRDEPSCDPWSEAFRAIG